MCSDSENSWLLLVMRDHVSHAELGYFVENLLPFAMKMRLKGTLVRACAGITTFT